MNEHHFHRIICGVYTRYSSDWQVFTAIYAVNNHPNRRIPMMLYGFRTQLIFLRSLVAGAIVSVTLAERAVDTAEQAIASFDHKTPDLLVVDYQLPDMDGFQFLEAVRNQGVDSPPAIMISAYSHLKDEARKNGFQGFLEKPFSTFSLSHAIELALV